MADAFGIYYISDPGFDKKGKWEVIDENGNSIAEFDTYWECQDEFDAILSELY